MKTKSLIIFLIAIMMATVLFSPIACENLDLDNGGTPPGENNGGTSPDDNDGGTLPDDTNDDTSPGDTNDITSPGDTNDDRSPSDTNNGVPIWVWIAVSVGPLLVLILGLFIGRRLSTSKATPYSSEENITSGPKQGKDM